MGNEIKRVNVNYEQCYNILEEYANIFKCVLNPQTKSIDILDEKSETVLTLKLPFLFIFPHKNEAVENYLERLPPLPYSYLILLIQADAAAYAFCETGEIIEHKARRAYTIRKSRGKSQQKHLRQKGKSRMGSRIRLQQTKKFYVNINNDLQKWEYEIATAKSVFYSADVRTFNAFFEENENSVINISDTRLEKLPFDVKPPDYAEVKRVNYLMNIGELIFYRDNGEINDLIDRII